MAQNSRDSGKAIMSKKTITCCKTGYLDKRSKTNVEKTGLRFRGKIHMIGFKNVSLN